MLHEIREPWDYLGVVYDESPLNLVQSSTCPTPTHSSMIQCASCKYSSQA